LNIRATLVVALMTVALVLPHALGLATVYGAEGYTSELFHSENGALQVAYPGYREAVQWLAAHTHGPATIGFGAVLGTLDASGGYAEVVGTPAAKTLNASWYSYNSDLPARFKISEVHPTDQQFYTDYLVWPMHLVQRGYPLPEAWRTHVVHIVMGGETIYCYVMARNPASISSI
jgi:hypothetical protein